MRFSLQEHLAHKINTKNKVLKNNDTKWMCEQKTNTQAAQEVKIKHEMKNSEKGI